MFIFFVSHNSEEKSGLAFPVIPRKCSPVLSDGERGTRFCRYRWTQGSSLLQASACAHRQESALIRFQNRSPLSWFLWIFPVCAMELVRDIAWEYAEEDLKGNHRHVMQDRPGRPFHLPGLSDLQFYDFPGTADRNKFSFFCESSLLGRI